MIFEDESCFGLSEDFFKSAEERIEIVGKPRDYKYEIETKEDHIFEVIPDFYKKYLNEQIDEYQLYRALMQESYEIYENTLDELVKFILDHVNLPKEYVFPQVKLVTQQDPWFGEYDDTTNTIKLNKTYICNKAVLALILFHEFAHSIITVYEYNTLRLKEEYISSNFDKSIIKTALKNLSDKDPELFSLSFEDIFCSESSNRLISYDEPDRLDKKNEKNNFSSTLTIFTLKQKEEIAADAFAEYLMGKLYVDINKKEKQELNAGLELYVKENIASRFWYNYKQFYISELMKRKSSLEIFLSNRDFILFNENKEDNNY